MGKEQSKFSAILDGIDSLYGEKWSAVSVSVDGVKFHKPDEVLGVKEPIKFKVEVKVTDIEIFNQTIEIIGKYKDHLPQDMIVELEGLLDRGEGNGND